MIKANDLAAIESFCAEQPEHVYPVTMPDGTEGYFHSAQVRETYLRELGKVNPDTGKERFACTPN
jgi:hypothetical protein